MSVQVKRKKGESFEALNRRFTRRLQQSGVVLETKKDRYHPPKMSHYKKKASAIRRLQLRVKREYLERTGQLVEEQRPQSQNKQQ